MLMWSQEKTNLQYIIFMSNLKNKLKYRNHSATLVSKEFKVNKINEVLL